MHKQAEILISTELLREVLCIPENVTILGVVHDAQHDQWSLVLAGVGLPSGCETLEGERPRPLKPIYHQEEGIVKSVCWKVWDRDRPMEAKT